MTKYEAIYRKVCRDCGRPMEPFSHQFLLTGKCCSCRERVSKIFTKHRVCMSCKSTMPMAPGGLCYACYRKAKFYITHGPRHLTFNKENQTVKNPIIENITKIDGLEASQHTTESLIALIMRIEARIKELSSIGVESKAITRMISKLQDGLKGVVKELDSRPREV